MANSTQMTEVTFIGLKGVLEIRLSDLPHTIVQGAEALQAGYVVMVDHVLPRSLQKVWGVYDMRKARKNEPLPGEVTLPLPCKTFASDTADGAIMWALTRGSK